MLILESATPPFITRPFVIGLPVKRKEEIFSFLIIIKIVHYSYQA